MRIAVCEDDINYRNKLVEQIKRCTELDLPLEEYDSGETLLDAYKSGMKYDLLFLNLQMSGVSGAEVAEQIRQMDRNVLFVFITCTSIYVHNSFHVRAVDFICKTNDIRDQQLQSVIDICKREYTENNRQIPMPIEGIMNVRVRDIEYVESKGRKALLHLQSEEVICVKLKLKEVLAKLQAFDFERCHRSYLVNLWSVCGFTDKTIKVKSGVEIPVSHKLLDSVKNARNKMNFRY